MEVAIVFAALPSTTNVADAGPSAASDGVEAGMAGKPAGSVSQMRPHAVSVWLALDAALDAAVDGAADVSGGVDPLGEAVAVLDPQAATTTVATNPRPRTRGFNGEWRMTDGITRPS